MSSKNVFLLIFWRSFPGSCLEAGVVTVLARLGKRPWGHRASVLQKGCGLVPQTLPCPVPSACSWHYVGWIKRAESWISWNVRKKLHSTRPSESGSECFGLEFVHGKNFALVSMSKPLHFVQGRKWPLEVHPVGNEEEHSAASDLLLPVLQLGWSLTLWKGRRETMQSSQSSLHRQLQHNFCLSQKLKIPPALLYLVAFTKTTGSVPVNKTTAFITPPPPLTYFWIPVPKRICWVSAINTRCPYHLKKFKHKTSSANWNMLCLAQNPAPKTVGQSLQICCSFPAFLLLLQIASTAVCFPVLSADVESIEKNPCKNIAAAQINWGHWWLAIISTTGVVLSCSFQQSLNVLSETWDIVPSAVLIGPSFLNACLPHALSVGINWAIHTHLGDNLRIYEVPANIKQDLACFLTHFLVNSVLCPWLLQDLST